LILVSEFIKADFITDGNLDKELWSGANPIRFHRSAFDKSSHPESETVIASLWTEHFLYLACWCRYQTLNVFQGEDIAVERWELWNRDVVEVFLNPQPQCVSHYYEFEVAPNNQWLDLEIDLTCHPPGNALWHSGFEHTARIDAMHRIWTVEMRIPLLSIGVERLQPDVEWRVNFCRCDGPGEGTARRMLSWGALPVSSQKSFHQPASFGTLYFHRRSGMAF
jgi:alpha-galactosidase